MATAPLRAVRAGLRLGRPRKSLTRTLNPGPSLRAFTGRPPSQQQIIRTLARIKEKQDYRRGHHHPREMYDMRNKAFGGDLLMSLDW